MNEHSLLGKIARLPKSVREKLNRRLDDGQPAGDILPWLNALPRVQKILAAKFDAKPVIRQNLDNWRATGFLRWQQKQEPIARLADLAEDAAEINRTAGGRLARGAATIAAAQILEFLKTIPKEKRSPHDALKVASAVTSLLKADQNNVRLKIEKRKVRQRDAQLRLMRDKHHRDVISIGQRLLDDERAKIIQYGPFSNAEKIELLGRHIFGEFWVPRLLPVPKSSPAAPKPPGEDSLSQRERDGVRENTSYLVPAQNETEPANSKLETKNSKFLSPPEITPGKTTAQVIAEIEEYAIQHAAARRAAAISNESGIRPNESLDATRNTHHTSSPIHQPLAASKPATAGKGGSTINQQPGYYGPCPAPHSSAASWKVQTS